MKYKKNIFYCLNYTENKFKKMKFIEKWNETKYIKYLSNVQFTYH